jgi:hypothetical protein
MLEKVANDSNKIDRLLATESEVVGALVMQFG